MALGLNRFSILFLFLFGSFFLFSPTQAQEVTVEFDSLWVNYDVTRNGELGMVIHTKFTVHNLLNVPAYLSVRILRDDEPLKSTTSGYRNQNGDLAIFKDLTPAYVDAFYSDLDVFIPYREIKSGAGKQNLEIDADLIHENGDMIQHFTLHAFEFTGVDYNIPVATNEITAEFDTMWIDYDVTQGGEKGILFHVTFSVQKMKGISGIIAFGFETAEGDRLYTSNENFRSTNGQLTIYKNINPTFEDSYYEDLQVFMPYREIIVGEGANNLRIHVDILHGDGGNVHLTYFDFTFTRTF